MPAQQSSTISDEVTLLSSPAVSAQRERRGAVASAMAGTLATDIGLVLLSLVTGPVVARLLNPEGRGALAAVVFWPNVLAVVMLLTLNDAAACTVGKYPARRNEIFATAFRLSVLMAIPACVITYFALPLLLGEGRSDLVQTARVYALIFLPANFTVLTMSAADQGELRFLRYNVLRILVPAAYATGLLFLWLSGAVSVTTLAIANAVGNIVALGVRFGTEWRRILGNAADWLLAREIFSTALRFHPATLLTSLATQTDAFIVLTLWSNDVLGHYVVAQTLASTGLNVVTSAFQRVLYPNLARREGVSQTGLLARGVRIASLLLVSMSLILALASPIIVPLLFGSAFRDSVYPAMMLTFAYVFIALRNLLVFMARGIGDATAGTVACATSLVIFMPTAWLLGNAIGLVGVAAAAAISNAAAVGYILRRIRVRTGISGREMWGLNVATVRELLAQAKSLAGRSAEPVRP